MSSPTPVQTQSKVNKIDLINKSVGNFKGKVAYDLRQPLMVTRAKFGLDQLILRDL